MLFTSKAQVEKYLSHDEIECLECGRRFEFLPAHIKRAHGLSAAEYREKFNLPAGTPLAGRAYRDMHRRKLAALVNSGRLTYEHLPTAVEAAREAVRAPRTDFDLAAQTEHAKNIRRKQLPPGARRADGRDADRAREYQREYRARRKQQG